MIPERKGYIIWVSNIKAALNLDKYGTLHYISKKMQYAVLYVNADQAEEVVKCIRRIQYVKKIERSYRNEIKIEYSKDVPDNMRYYGV